MKSFKKFLTQIIIEEIPSSIKSNVLTILKDIENFIFESIKDNPYIEFVYFDDIIFENEVCFDMVENIQSLYEKINIDKDISDIGDMIYRFIKQKSKSLNIKKYKNNMIITLK